MVNIILDYAVVSPAVVDTFVRSFGFEVLCKWEDIDEDCFEFQIMSYNDNEEDVELAMLKVMEQFVWAVENEDEDED